MISENKKCSKCGISKPRNDFRKNGKYWMGKCKICQKEYNNILNPIYIKNNKEKYQLYARKANKKAYNRGQEFIDEYKKFNGCKKCSDKRYWLIDLHHLDPLIKDHPITYYKTSPIDKIKKEIEKCVPLCRNCHTDFHYLEKTQNITIQEYLNENRKNDRTFG